MKTYKQTRTLPGFDKKILLGAMLASGMAIASGGALAGATETGNLQVTASVLQTCTISDGRLSFGQYESGQEDNLDATSVDVVANCTTGTVYQVYSTTATREMVKAGGGTPITFQLYSDSGRTVVLPTSNISGVIQGTGTGADQTIPIYGRIPALQEPAAGNYALQANLTIFY